MKSITRFSRLAVVAAVAAAGAQAQASTVTFDSLGDSATFIYSGLAAGASLSGAVTYSLTSWAGKNAVFHVTSTNTSSGAGSGLNPNRLVSFGVAVVNPDLTSAVVPGLTEWDAVVSTNFPGFGQVELCNYAGPTCAGGAGLGTFMGQTDAFDLTLTFAQNVGALRPISFNSPFVSKWQNVGTTKASYEVDGCLQGDTRCDARTPPAAIPEPTSLTLVALALLGAGGLTRRQRR